MTDDLLERVEDGVAVLTLNRPDRRNALSEEMLEALLAAVSRIAVDESIGCVVVTGAGGAFCAGGDVKAMSNNYDDSKSMEDRINRLRRMMEVSRWLHEMPKPTIAMIPGPAAGAGLSIALSCDLRVAVPTAKITTAFVKVGFSGDFGGTYFLTQLVGTAKARELYLLGDVITAEEGAGLGLINRLAEPESLEADTMALAKRIAGGPRVANRYIKKNLNAAEHSPNLADHLDLEAIHHSRCSLTQDHKEATKAFVEKRAPVFVGR